MYRLLTYSLCKNNLQKNVNSPEGIEYTLKIMQFNKYF